MERLAWVPVTTWPRTVSLTPTFQWASAVASILAWPRRGPVGREPPLRELPAEPTLHFSSRTFWASSRLLMSGFAWRATEAATALVGALADLPRLERASRRAMTMARLGLCWAVRLATPRRSPLPLRALRFAREAPRPEELPLLAAAAALASLQPQGRSVAAATTGLEGEVLALEAFITS